MSCVVFVMSLSGSFLVVGYTCLYNREMCEFMYVGLDPSLSLMEVASD